MTPALPTAIVAALELWAGTVFFPWGAPLLWAGGATGWVAVAYALNRPEMLGKERAPRVASVLLYPYLATGRSAARLAQRAGLPERAEVAPGLWVGGWPGPGPSPLAHLDVTAELGRRSSPAAYRCIPMLDGAAPRPGAWEAAVEQIVTWRKEGREVLVHCAYGHGRSVSVLIGALVALGHADGISTALALVQRVRPRARLTPAQRRLVEARLTEWKTQGLERLPSGSRPD